MKITLLIALSAILGSAYAAPCSDEANGDCATLDRDTYPGANGCGCVDGGEASENCLDEVCPPDPTNTVAPPETTCVCPEYPAVTPLPTLQGESAKEYKKRLVGTGVGICECDGGVAELRFVYLGSIADVKIEIFTGKDDAPPLMCSYDGVQPNEEIVCNLRGEAPGFVSTLGLYKFSSESPFTITYPNAAPPCKAQYHTSCSSDIVGIVQPLCDELVVSGWKDNDNYDDGECDDGITPCYCGSTVVEPETEPEPEFVDIIIGDKCYCERETTTTTTTRRLKGSKSKKGKSKGGSDGLGIGDCDCDGGQATLKLMYQGVGAVDVAWFYKDGTPICKNVGVEPGDEIECNSQPMYEKLGTNTYVRIREQGTTTERCQTEIHTSCSRDIVGTYGDGECGDDLIVSGWKDTGNLNDGLECDDGMDLCDCSTYVEPPNDPETEPVVQVADYCWCSTVTGNRLSSDTTAAPVQSSKSKSKAKKSKNRKDGYGWGGCDCDGGVYMLRFVYKGDAPSVDIELFYDEYNEVICRISGVSYGEENECSLVDAPLDDQGGRQYWKLQKESYIRLTDGNGNTCQGSWHTSCSSDIVGWTAEGCEDIIISGWSGNDNTEECTNGYEPCDCDDTCSVFSTDIDEMYESSACDREEGCFISESTGKCANTASNLYQGGSANSQNYFVAVVVSIVAAVRYF